MVNKEAVRPLQNRHPVSSTHKLPRKKNLRKVGEKV